MSYILETKQKIRDLEAQKANIDDQIKLLKEFLGLSKSDKSANMGESPSISVRGGVDIRPTVKSIFEKNGNKSMKVKEIVEAVMKEMSLDKLTVERKMEYAKSNILEKDPTGYGMYRLKQSP